MRLDPIDCYDRNDEGGDHRADLAPRVDAPPVPAQNQDESRAGSEREQEFPGAFYRSEVVRNDGGGEEEKYRRPARNRYVVLLGRGPVEESLVEIVDQVGRAPVELSPDGGHVRSGEARHHEPTPRGWKQIYERLHVRRFVI